MTLLLFILFLLATILTVISPQLLQKKPINTQFKVYILLSLIDIVLIILFFIQYLLFTNR